MNYSSRWQKISEGSAKKRAAALLAASGIILILGLVFGIPAVFRLTSLILSARNLGPTVQTDPQFVPMTPRLSQEYEATKSAEIKISGVADSKTAVELFQNGNSDGTTTTDENGQFSFVINLQNGQNSFTAQSLSSNNKKSALSQAYVIYYLTKEPKLELENLKETNEVKDNPVTVGGQTDPGVSIIINDHFVYVDSSGGFKYNLNLQNGDNKVVILATDKAGNETKKEITIKYSP